jgi:hypothetical protein
MSDGRICLGPRAVEVGDVVVVFLGCETPLVLRPHGLGQFKLIGEAYCPGVMHGEPLLGPLGNGWKRVMLPMPSKGDVSEIAFMNMETRDISAQDPRLGPLPSGWNAHYDIEQHHWWFWIAQTAEITPFDPRLTPECLRERGVEVRDFEVVEYMCVHWILKLLSWDAPGGIVRNIMKKSSTLTRRLRFILSSTNCPSTSRSSIGRLR